MRGISAKLRIGLITILLAGCASTPGAIPVKERLAPCPDSPNCVSSYAQDDVHAIEPLPIPADQDATGALRRIVESLPRTTIVTVDGDYLHATFASRIFRFVDDVEFLVDREAGVVHVRSASRLGYGDMGVNRRRIEEIRSLLTD